MNRSTITILVPSLGVGGSIRSAIRLAEGISQRGYQVDLVSMRNLDALAGEVPESVRLIRFGASRVRWSLISLIRYLKAEQPRAVIAVSTVANLMALAAIRLARTSTPLLITEHNYLSSKAAKDDRWTEQQSPRLARLMYHRADRIATVSEGVADDLARTTCIDREEIEVIHNPTYSIDCDHMAARPVDDDWFASGAPPVILAVGRLHRQKDFPTLLHAFQELRLRHVARLMILGEGPQRLELEELVRHLGLTNDVRLPGFDPNPYRYMSRSRMFVLSSLWEGLPGVLIQAMSAECPVISTDCHSGPREILLDGKLGRLVPVGNPRLLAEAMSNEITNPQSVIGLRQRAMDFSVEKCVDAHLSVLSLSLQVEERPASCSTRIQPIESTPIRVSA